jgi:hypothetical protein
MPRSKKQAGKKGGAIDGGDAASGGNTPVCCARTGCEKMGSKWCGGCGKVIHTHTNIFQKMHPATHLSHHESHHEPPQCWHHHRTTLCKPPLTSLLAAYRVPLHEPR